MFNRVANCCTVGKRTIIYRISDIVRFAPSACNTQPWIVENEENTLYVYRYKKPGKRGIMPADMVSFYNQAEIKIDAGLDDEKTLVAVYGLSQE